jgi:hypothetical protein
MFERSQCDYKAVVTLNNSFSRQNKQLPVLSLLLLLWKIQYETYK